MAMTVHHVYWWTSNCFKAGYPPCVITVENRFAYYEALDQWMAYGKTEAFIQLVSDAVLEGFKPNQVVLGL